MKYVKIEDRRDYGELCVAKQSLSSYSFRVCALSLGYGRRSVFEECIFSELMIRKCSIGFPIFKRCHFHDIVSDKSGVLVYGAGFSECIFSGSLRNVAIGFMYEVLVGYEQDRAAAKRFQEENVDLARTSAFAIDFTQADLELVAIRGETILPFVRFGPKQAVILRGDGLYEKLLQIGRAEKNRDISNFFLGTGALPGCLAAIAITNKAARECLGEIEERLRRHDIEVSHY